MRLIGLLTLFLSTSAVLFAQAQSASGDVKGTISDPTGASIAKAKVTITNADRGITRATTADDHGDYSLPLLPPGSYRLRVESPGFSTVVLDDVAVRVGDIVVLNVPLKVGDVATEIDVKAEVPLIETERVQQANTIEQGRIRDLPINRRNYLDFALLAPATADTTDLVDGTDLRPAQTPQSGISFGGGNGRGNGFFIDGVENYLSSGGVRLSMSQEAVQEFQINRNSFSAEFSWAAGGTVNIVSKSGTNDLHGNVFGFLRHRDLQARNFFDPGKSSYTRLQSGATLAAPIRRDRTFFFFGYERLDRQETSFVPILQDRSAFTRLTTSQKALTDFLATIPSTSSVAAALNRVLVPANYPDVVNLFNANSGNFPFSEDTHMVSARIDHRISDRQNVFARFNQAQLDQKNAQFGALVAYNRGRQIKQWDGTAMLSHAFVINPSWVVETRLMLNHSRLDVVPIDSNGPEINIAGYGYFGREIFLPSTSYERHYQVIQNWSFHSGSQDLKFGFDVNPVSTFVDSKTFFSGRFNFGEVVPLTAVLAGVDPRLPATISGLLNQTGRTELLPSLTTPISALQSYALGIPAFYQQGFGNPIWTAWTKRQGFYLQDSFRPRKGLTLNFGVRYDLELNPVIGSSYGNIAPRAGFAWTPGSSGKTVIRGGYGHYYTMTNLQIANVADTLSGASINQVFATASGIPIINPITKLPLTSTDVYRTMKAKGVLGVRAISAADIAPLGLVPGPGLPGRVVFGSEPQQQAYAQQASLEIERSIGREFSLSAGYNYNRGLHGARITGRNVRYSGRILANGSPGFAPIDPSILQRNIFTYDGNSIYSAGYVMIAKRFSGHVGLNAHYTLSRAIDDFTDFNSDFSPMNQLDARAERALSPFHHKHRFVANAVVSAPTRAHPVLRDWNVSPIVQARSWRPFNVLTGADVNGDNYSTNDRPYGLGRDAGQGPIFVTFDMRLSRRFAFGAEGRRNVEFIADGFNLLNHTNFKTVNNTVGNVAASSLPNPLRGTAGVPTNPLAFTSAYDARQFQLGLKINW